MLSTLGLLGGLALLILLTMRGVNLLLAAPLCAVVVAVLGGMPLLPPLAAAGGTDLVSGYMGAFAGFLKSYYLVFLLGAVFGKVMEASGAAAGVARWAVERLGRGSALLAVVVACSVLTYGGVSLFVVAFAVHPLAVNLFRRANLPRRFIPGALALGSITYTMTSAGSPEIQNWIPIEFLRTTPYAAWKVSLVVALVMAFTGYLWLRHLVRGAVARGEGFVERAGDPPEDARRLPPTAAAMAPLAVVLGVSFLLHDRLQQSALLVALAAGLLTCVALNFRFSAGLGRAAADGAVGALVAIGNTCAVVGFGGVAKATPAFQSAVDLMTHLPGSPLLGAALAVAVIAGLTGSASGGQVIALPVLAPVYLAQGVPAEALHRIVAIASGSLDSLPHNGYVVTTIRSICGETHRDAYGAVAVTTVVVPALGLGLAIVLFALGL